MVRHIIRDMVNTDALNKIYFICDKVNSSKEKSEQQLEAIREYCFSVSEEKYKSITNIKVDILSALISDRKFVYSVKFTIRYE